MQAPTSYNTSPGLGIWPFTSEKEETYSDLLRKYDWAFYKAMVPQMGIWESTKAFFIGPDWARDFFKRYMVVAEEIGPYTAGNADTFMDRLSDFYDAELLNKMLTTLEMMYAEGEIPRALYDPASVDLDEDSPLDKALKAMREGAKETGRTVTRILIIGAVGYLGYQVVKGELKKRRRK